MRSFKTILCAIALAATLATLEPIQLPNLSLSPNSTFLYDNETFSTLPSSNLTSLHDNLTSLALPSSNISLLPNQPNHAASPKQDPLPPDPTYEHYGFATMGYFGYGPSVDIAGAIAVFREVLLDCRRHRPRAQMGTNTRNYTAGSVSLVFNPGAAILWSTWELVRDKLVEFATDYGYPELSFTVASPESGQLLGGGQLRTIDSNNLPPDPFYIQFSQGAVKFTDYGPAIDKIDTLKVITEATIDCLQHPRHTEVIDAALLVYPEGPVSLTLGPGPLMTWGQWTDVIYVIKMFLDSYEYIEFNFSIWNEQAGNIGRGNLSQDS